MGLLSLVSGMRKGDAGWGCFKISRRSMMTICNLLASEERGIVQLWGREIPRSSRLSGSLSLLCSMCSFGNVVWLVECKDCAYCGLVNLLIPWVNNGQQHNIQEGQGMCDWNQKYPGFGCI